VKLTTHLRLVSRLRIHDAVSPLLYVFPWRGALLSTEYIFMAWCLVKHTDNSTDTEVDVMINRQDLFSGNLGFKYPHGYWQFLFFRVFFFQFFQKCWNVTLKWPLPLIDCLL